MNRLPQITIFVMLSFAIYVVGCDSATDMGPTSSEHQAGDIDIDAVTQSIYGSKSPRIDICHKRHGNLEYILLNISVHAEARHRAHGDGRPGEAVPGIPLNFFRDDCVLMLGI